MGLVIEKTKSFPCVIVKKTFQVTCGVVVFSIRNQDCICRNMEGFMQRAWILLDEMHKP